MKLESWVNPVYLKRKDLLKKHYKKMKPFPHASLSVFLQEEKAIALERALRQQEFTRKESDLFSFFQTHDLLTVKNDTIAEFLALVQSEEFLSLITEITGEQLSGEIDAMGAIYADTDCLLCHDDQLEGRKIAYVLNLSKGFTNDSGGALALLDADKTGRPRKVVKRIMPEWNTLAIFTVSKTSHHMVEEVLEEKERLTIGGWLHG